MKQTRMRIATALLGTLLALPVAAPAQMKPEVALRAAMETETVKGDLKGAIEQYKKIAQGSDRVIAAKALVRMAECYAKLGDAESRKIYERVVREFADQKEAVTTARARLGSAAAKGAGIVVRQVWAPALDTEGAPSPDGRYLSFVDWSTGDLAIRDLTTSENRRLTNKGPWSASEEFALYSSFSPDGKQVAYAWFNAPSQQSWELRIVSAAAGTEVSKPRILYRDGDIDYIQPADWSADGKQILALMRRKDRTHQIAMVSVADGSARILKSFDWRAPMKMSLSPNGRYIAYDFPPKEDSPERDIFVLAADGSRESTVVQHPANDASPVWTPDGKGILFASDRTGAMGAWLTTMDGKAQRPPDLIKADIGRMAPMAFTRSGSLFYGLMIGNINVYIGKLDWATRKLQEPLKSVSEHFTGFNGSPDWSPDGRHLAYFSRRSFLNTPGSTVVCVLTLDTGQEKELRPELAYIGGLRWSPDGQALFLWGTDGKGRKGIFQIDATLGTLTPIVATGEDFRHPLPSPDGRLLYYRSSRAIVRDRETGREEELLPAGRLFINYWTLSRDGSQLALLVSQLESKSTAIYVMPARGGEPRQIIALPDISGQVLDWEPDGRGLVFARARNSELWRISTEGGKPEKLDLTMFNMRLLRLHPDGQRIVFNAGEPKSEVWAMENFLPTLTAIK
ncbi:MAG: PD40 domain-containing protein [Acidobacteriia bacterium]|nr:PD40 domain-containing protein [Terriglobia bacterium]